MAVCEIGWRVLGIASFLLGPVAFFFGVLFRVRKLVVKEKTLAFVPVPSRSWKGKSIYIPGFECLTGAHCVGCARI